MFTGLVEELGVIKDIKRKSVGGLEIAITAGVVLKDLKLGDSIAVNGACLTATSVKGHVFTVDVMPESLRVTTLGELRPGDRVNLERALRLGDRLGGHLVSGHIDSTGIITRKVPDGNAVLLEVFVEQQSTRYVITKGSIAVDGVSLTVVQVRDSSFTVSLIPHTAAVTTLGFKGPGNRVNLEFDVIGKYVERLVRGWQEKTATGEISLEFLQEHGF